MPELLWTDAHHDAPTLPPPRARAESATSVEIPRALAATSNRASSTSASSTRLEVPRPLVTRPLPEPRIEEMPTVRPPRPFDPRASAALPLLKRIDDADEVGCWSAESSTTMWIRETRALPLLRPLDKLCILMTQALPLIRVDESERLERRAIAERAAIVVVGAAALVMTMLAVASALTRIAG